MDLTSEVSLRSLTYSIMEKAIVNKDYLYSHYLYDFIESVKYGTKEERAIIFETMYIKLTQDNNFIVESEDDVIEHLQDFADGYSLPSIQEEDFFDLYREAAQKALHEKGKVCDLV